MFHVILLEKLITFASERVLKCSFSLLWSEQQWVVVELSVLVTLPTPPPLSFRHSPLGLATNIRKFLKSKTWRHLWLFPRYWENLSARLEFFVVDAFVSCPQGKYFDVLRYLELFAGNSGKIFRRFYVIVVAKPTHPKSSKPRNPVRSAGSSKFLQQPRLEKFLSPDNQRALGWARGAWRGWRRLEEHHWAGASHANAKGARALRQQPAADHVIRKQGILWLRATLDLNHLTPRKYVFEVTSVDQRSLPWTRNMVKVEKKLHLECKLRFPCGQLTNAFNEHIWK